VIPTHRGADERRAGADNRAVLDRGRTRECRVHGAVRAYVSRPEIDAGAGFGEWLPAPRQGAVGARQTKKKPDLFRAGPLAFLGTLPAFGSLASSGTLRQFGSLKPTGTLPFCDSLPFLSIDTLAPSIAINDLPIVERTHSARRQDADDLLATIGDFLLFRRVELISDPAHIFQNSPRSLFNPFEHCQLHAAVCDGVAPLAIFTI